MWTRRGNVKLGPTRGSNVAMTRMLDAGWARSILVVDSDPHSREALASSCTSTGWSVRTADRSAAVLAAATPAPDYLLVEDNPADGSVYSLFRRLREANPRLEAVMFSRQPSISQAVQAIRMGFRDYRGVPSGRVSLQVLFTKEPIEALAPRNDVAPANLSLARVQWDHICAVLTDVGGNVSEAARVLGVHRRSLQRKLSRGGGDRAR
jgi:two-component system response regulator RegA